MTIARRTFLLTAAAAAALPGARALAEAPILAAEVAAGRLPPLSDRLPAEPLVCDLAARGRMPGVQGGTLRTIFTRARDIRLMVVYGYARLVGYDESYRLQPDILRAVEHEGYRSFTLHLRRGHRWSDGHPFTTEDFRYWWEDVANDSDLSPSGPPEFMLVEGEPPEVTILSETAIRFAWPAPNPRFLPTLAQARDPFIYRPAHVLKAFHARYTDVARLEPRMAAEKARNWAQLHNKIDEMYNFDNPALPTLQPWVNTSAANNQLYVLVRNPYFHRVDMQGTQLPYIDRVEVSIAAGGLVASKVTLGETDLQVRALSFADAPVLKRGEATGGYVTRMWKSGVASEIALYPNLNYIDPAFRALFRDVRFRRALSLGADRRTINRSIYFGLAEERANAALPASPLFDRAHAEAFAAHDVGAANALLDEIGLTGRAGDGIRLLADGRRLEIVVESAGERKEEADAMELLTEAWRAIGVGLIHRPLDRDILRNAAYRGESMMPIWYGWDNGLPTPDTPPDAQAPVDQATFCWPMWGQHFQTRGAAGEPPDLPEAQELLALHRAWMRSESAAARADIWRRMLAIHAEQVFVIGLVSGVPQPVAVSRRLANVPEAGIFAWDPGAHLGIHRMDEFFFTG
jgi:peptide/nickel transport system substrate-binding protein